MFGEIKIEMIFVTTRFDIYRTINCFKITNALIYVND